MGYSEDFDVVQYFCEFIFNRERTFVAIFRILHVFSGLMYIELKS